jgi:3D (Asp-Asp-Asp) domain-containing protein
MTVKALVATFAVFTTIGGNVMGENNKSYNTLSKQGFEVCVMNVRATTYHKTEPGADRETRRGESSTGVRLTEVKPKVVGSIAIDPKVIPYGSLVIVTTKRGESHLFLCVDTGGAVKSRKASKALAKKQKLGSDWSKRPVIDIYSAKHYEDWMTVVVIKDKNPLASKDSGFRERLKERMSADYWPDSQEIVARALQQRDANFLAQR